MPPLHCPEPCLCFYPASVLTSRSVPLLPVSESSLSPLVLPPPPEPAGSRCVTRLKLIMFSYSYLLGVGQ